MKKNDYLVQSHLTSKGEYAVQVEVKSNETEETAMVLAGIKTLIDAIDISLLEEEEASERYNQAMREIIGYIANDIGFKTGYYAKELQAEIFLDETDEPAVNKKVQMELIKNYFD